MPTPSSSHCLANEIPYLFIYSGRDELYEDFNSARNATSPATDEYTSQIRQRAMRVAGNKFRGKRFWMGRERPPAAASCEGGIISCELVSQN